MIGMAGLAAFNLLLVQSAVDAAGAAVALQSQAREVTADLSRGQASLYRAITVKSQNGDIGAVRSAKNDSMQIIAQARKTLAALNVEELAIDVRLVPAAVKAVDAYIDVAKLAASFVEDGAFNATMFMTDAEVKYATAGQEVAALLAAAAKQSGTNAQEIKDMMRNGLIVIPTGAGLAVLLSVASSMVFSWLTSKPIVAMTAVMRRLAGEVKALTLGLRCQLSCREAADR